MSEPELNVEQLTALDGVGGAGSPHGGDGDDIGPGGKVSRNTVGYR